MSEFNAANGELEFTRVVEAPRELVFEVWTRAEHLAEWWGPKGFTMRVSSLDLRPGGTFLYCMVSPAGDEMWGKFVYHEIVAPERIVFVTCFADQAGITIRNPWSASWPLEIKNTLTLRADGHKTILTLCGTPIHANTLEQETFDVARKSVQHGLGGTMDQLESYLANLQNMLQEEKE